VDKLWSIFPLVDARTYAGNKYKKVEVGRWQEEARRVGNPSLEEYASAKKWRYLITGFELSPTNYGCSKKSIRLLYRSSGLDLQFILFLCYII
jgi:hypothetical protein